MTDHKVVIKDDKASQPSLDPELIEAIEKWLEKHTLQPHEKYEIHLSANPSPGISRYHVHSQSINNNLLLRKQFCTRNGVFSVQLTSDRDGVFSKAAKQSDTARCCVIL